MNNKTHLFTNILQEYKYKLNSGDIVAGTIFFQELNGFLVNIGDHISGYLPQDEINQQFAQNQNNQNLLINITRDFFIIKYNIKLKQYILSIKRLEYIRSWKRIKQIQLENCTFNLKINYINKGGLITYLEGIQAFIPKSHIDITKKINLLPQKSIQCKILKINDQKNQLILSAKSAFISLLKHKFRIGEIIYGTIIKIKSYGLFIKINKIIALLHISEISNKYIANINNIFYIGKLIKIKIIHIDKKQGRISVSKRNIKYNLKNNKY